VAALAVVGFGVASYLTMYQIGVVRSVWDPFFGSGSERVLTSSVSRALPVPDAALGAIAYLLEAIAELSGGRDRWYRQSWNVFVAGLLAAGLAVAGIVLVLTQAVFVRAFCTLCLGSAVISFAIAALVAEEVRATIASLRAPST
jgi:uncharacterized membrane protein